MITFSELHLSQSPKKFNWCFVWKFSHMEQTPIEFDRISIECNRIQTRKKCRQNLWENAKNKSVNSKSKCMIPLVVYNHNYNHNHINPAKILCLNPDWHQIKFYVQKIMKRSLPICGRRLVFPSDQYFRRSPMKKYISR